MNIEAQTPLEPFIKWAGGKRQLLDALGEYVPAQINTYYEPFVGGGALLFYLLPEKAVINDINKELINTYSFIKSNPDEFMKILSQLDNVPENSFKEHYYTVREQYNSKIKNNIYDIEMAAMFVFVNKHCFNGLYRVNKQGYFNVPYNNSTSASFSKENISAISSYLQNTAILNGDFEAACQNAKKGDFVFFDSPYAPLNSSSFDGYTKAGFSEEEHIRLAKLFAELTAKGCKCLLTNHNTGLIQSLYSEYYIEEVNVFRHINSNPSKRTGKEVIIRNYI